MGVLTRDPDETARRLGRWLSEARGLDDVQVGDIELPGATGWSNETILFRASWADPSSEGDGTRRDHELVARVAPREYTVFPDDTFAAQFDLLRLLADRGTVPVPRVHWYESEPRWLDNPFWIMDRVRGDIATDAPPYASAGWLAEASKADQERAWRAGIDAMARVHTLGPGDLGDVMTRFAPTGSSPGEHLDHLERFLGWAEADTPFEDARRGIDILRRDVPPPPAEGPTLVWGDARLSNLIFSDFEVVAVLDWETASVGDPLLDLAWWWFSDTTLTVGTGATRLPGFASRDETARRWSELTGRDSGALDWYELFASVRFAVIMLRMGGLLHEVGFADAEFARTNFIAQAMRDRIAAW